MSSILTAAPCASCPFRKDRPIYLRRDRRVDIATELANGSTFHCHAEVDYDTEDEHGESEPDTSRARHCAGAAKAILLDGATTNLMRVAERLGDVDLDALAERGPDVWPLSEWQQLAEGATGDNPTEDPDAETEPCNTVGPNCLAPAGWLGSSGGIVQGTESADGECASCGEPLCSECADADGDCMMCTELDDDDE